MADKEVILDDDVRRIAGVRLVPRLGRPWDVYYEIIFVDGRVQLRPLSACACPDAIAHFEGRYFQSAHRDGLPGMRMLQPDDVDAKSKSIDESRSRDAADDCHLDNIPSDDSVWYNIVDSQARSATLPTVAKGEVEDDGVDPWGNQPAPDPWTAQAPAPAARDRDTKTVDSWHHYRPIHSYIAESTHSKSVDKTSSLPSKRTTTMKELGVVGSLFAEHFASQARKDGASLPAKQVKVETISDEDEHLLRGNKGPVVCGQRKRRLGQRDSKKAQIGAVTLSDDEDGVPRVPAKKSKKRENDAIVYVLSSDSEDHLGPSKH